MPLAAILACKFSFESKNRLEECEHKTSILSVFVATQALIDFKFD